jgi:hypothetical protein
MTVFSLCDSSTASQPQNRLAWGYPTLRVCDCCGIYNYVRLCGVCHSTAFVAKAHIDSYRKPSACPCRLRMLVTPHCRPFCSKDVDRRGNDVDSAALTCLWLQMRALSRQMTVCPPRWLYLLHTICSRTFYIKRCVSRSQTREWRRSPLFAVGDHSKLCMQSTSSYGNNPRA